MSVAFGTAHLLAQQTVRRLCIFVQAIETVGVADLRSNLASASEVCEVVGIGVYLTALSVLRLERTTSLAYRCQSPLPRSTVASHF